MSNLHNSNWKSISTQLLRCQKGMTLVEVMISALIVSLSVVLFLFVQFRTKTNSERSRVAYLASGTLEDAIEDMRSEIRANPVKNFPPSDRSFERSGIRFELKLDDAYLKKPVKDVKQVTCYAIYKNGTKTDTFTVISFLARNY